MQHGPGDLALRILDLRAYARMKQQVEYADAHEDDDSVTVDYDDERVVREVQMRVAEERRDEEMRLRGNRIG